MFRHWKQHKGCSRHPIFEVSLNIKAPRTMDNNSSGLMQCGRFRLTMQRISVVSRVVPADYSGLAFDEVIWRSYCITCRLKRAEHCFSSIHGRLIGKQCLFLLRKPWPHWLPLKRKRRAKAVFLCLQPWKRRPQPHNFLPCRLTEYTGPVFSVWPALLFGTWHQQKKTRPKLFCFSHWSAKLWSTQFGATSVNRAPRTRKDPEHLPEFYRHLSTFSR